MPIFLVDPADLDKAYSWMGAVYAPAPGGTHPVPADLTAQIAKLMEYIKARQPKKPDNGGGGTTDTRTRPPSHTARQPDPKTPPAQTNGGTGPLVTVPTGNGNGKVIVNPDENALPEGFPGKAEFEAEGHTTLAAVEALADKGELQSVSGVGPKIEEQVTQYLGAFKD